MVVLLCFCQALPSGHGASGCPGDFYGGPQGCGVLSEEAEEVQEELDVLQEGALLGCGFFWILRYCVILFFVLIIASSVSVFSAGVVGVPF